MGECEGFSPDTIASARRPHCWSQNTKEPPNHRPGHPRYQILSPQTPRQPPAGTTRILELGRPSASAQDTFASRVRGPPRPARPPAYSCLESFLSTRATRCHSAALDGALDSFGLRRRLRPAYSQAAQGYDGLHRVITDGLPAQLPQAEISHLRVPHWEPKRVFLCGRTLPARLSDSF